MREDGRRADGTLLWIAGISAVLAPLVLLAGDLLQVAGGFDFAYTVVLWVAFVLFVPAIAGAAYLARSGSRALAWSGGALAYLGSMAGAGMQALFRAQAVLAAGEETGAIDLLRGSAPLLFTTQVPGITFPLGLLLLSVALYRSRTLPMAASVLLAAGAVLFPVGHAVGLAAGLVVGDLLLAGAFAWIGRRLLAGAGAP